MTVTEWNLRQQARQLADAYATLEELSDTPPRPNHVRKMKPTFRPQSPTNDSDHTINLIYELMRDTPDDKIPGGLRSMACDALSYTTATGYAHDTQPGILCAHIAYHAQTITEKFPAVEELLELMQQQEHYIRRDINKRFGNPTNRPETRHTSTIIVRMLAQQGITITRQHLHTWAMRGHITQHHNHHNKPTYLLSEVIQWASRHHQNPPQ